MTIFFILYLFKYGQWLVDLRFLQIKNRNQIVLVGGN